MFHNYECQKAASLGDIFIWDGWNAEFRRVKVLTDLNITPHIQTSSVRSTREFSSERGVRMEYQQRGMTGHPTMHVEYKGESRYCIQAFDTVVESLDEVRLAADIAYGASKRTLVWDRDWIVATTVWNADAYTHLVSGVASSMVSDATGIVIPIQSQRTRRSKTTALPLN
jgi:hypothetical protein